MFFCEMNLAVWHTLNQNKNTVTILRVGFFFVLMMKLL